MLQELQNSILDLNRRLDEAKDRENTLLAVERQHKADAASLTAQMTAAEQRVADTDHKLAVMSTDLKVAAMTRSNELPPPPPHPCQIARANGKYT